MTKQIPKVEYVKHPYTKVRLRIIDTFKPSKEIFCPECTEGVVEEIKVVESEYRGGVRYNVVTCSRCNESVWVVLN